MPIWTQVSLKARELANRWEIENRKIGQGDENITLGYKQLEQASEHAHLTATTSRDVALINQETTLTTTRENIALGYRQLEQASEHAHLTAETSRDVALISQDTTLTATRENNEHAITIENIRSGNAVSQFVQQEHAKTLNAFRTIPIAVATTALAKEEETNRAMSGAVANMAFAMVQARLADKTREAEREHEMKMAKLNAKLERKRISHFKSVEVAAIFLLNTAGFGNMDNDALFRQFTEWMEVAENMV